MKTNLASFIEKDMEIISDMLIKAGMEHWDAYTFEMYDKTKVIEEVSDIRPFTPENDPNPGEPYINKSYKLLFGLSLTSKILTYFNGHEDVSTIWIGCKVSIPHEDVKEKSIFIKKLVNNLPINPFYDEDAYMGVFSKSESKQFTNLMFYLNPDYPDGFWQNHTL